MACLAKGWGMKREDFERLTKEELVDIIVKVATLKFNKTAQWYPQEDFINQDDIADVLRGNWLDDCYFDKE